MLHKYKSRYLSTYVCKYISFTVLSLVSYESYIITFYFHTYFFLMSCNFQTYAFVVGAICTQRYPPPFPSAISIWRRTFNFNFGSINLLFVFIGFSHILFIRDFLSLILLFSGSKDFCFCHST